MELMYTSRKLKYIHVTACSAITKEKGKRFSSARERNIFDWRKFIMNKNNVKKY